MKLSPLFVLTWALISFGLAGCQTTPTARQAPTQNSEIVRNNCYSLLHQLLGQEKDIKWLRFIKHENSDLKNLLKNISEAAATGDKRLELFARADPSLHLDSILLPPGEVKTRDDISSAEEKELLGESGVKLERTLLLTQVEALNYASHLAKVGGENDGDPGRAQYLKTLSEEMARLHDAAVVRLALTPALQHQK